MTEIILENTLTSPWEFGKITYAQNLLYITESKITCGRKCVLICLSIHLYMYTSNDVGLFGGLIFHSSDKLFKVKSGQKHPIGYV